MAKKHVSVVILSGGDSGRMFFPKPFLLFSSRTTFIEKLIKEYFVFGCSKIVIVLNKKIFIEDFFHKIKNKFKPLIVINKHPEYGKFYSLKLGIKKLGNEPFCFIQNIDNPFTNFSLLEALYKSRSKDSFVSPIYNEKGGHPILAGSDIIRGIKIKKSLDVNLRDFLNKYHRITVPTKNDKITANINTLKDYRKYFYYEVKQSV